MNSDSLNMVSRLGEGHMPCTFFLSEPQLKTTVSGHLKNAPRKLPWPPPIFNIQIQFMYVQYMIRPNSSSLIQNGDPVIKQSNTALIRVLENNNQFPFWENLNQQDA